MEITKERLLEIANLSDGALVMGELFLLMLMNQLQV